MPENSYTPRKHLFTVHSGVTVLMLDLIIKYYNLDPKNIYVLSRNNSLQAVLDLNLIPREQIFITDEIYDQYQQALSYSEQDIPAYVKNFYQLYRYILNSVFTLLDSNVDPELKVRYNCQLHREYLSQVDFDQILHGTAQAYFEPYEKATLPDLNLDFNFYTQHSADIISNILSHSKHCYSIKYCEEGTLNYIDINERLFDPYNSYLEYMETNYPQFNYEHLGLIRHSFTTLYQLDQINNPNLNLEQSGFIALSNLSFSKCHIDHVWENSKVNKKIITNIASHHISRDHNPYYLEQQEIYRTTPNIVNSESIQEALKIPSFMGNFVNIVITENYTKHHTTKEQYLTAHKELIRKVIKQGVFFFFIKFHPLLEQYLVDQLIQFLDQETAGLYRVIDHKVCLEKLFAESAHNSFIVHVINSSVGMYASKFSQITFTYTELYQDTACQKNLIEYHKFYIKDIISYFNQENGHSIQYHVA